MKEKVRISFDFPLEDHMILKSYCVHSRISMKDFLNDTVHEKVNKIKELELNKRLKKSVKQAKEGKVKSRGSFAKYVDDEV